MYFRQPIPNPLLCFRIGNAALGVEQDKMRLQRENARIQVVRAVHGIINC